MRDDRHRVRRRHKRVLAIDHVPIAISIARSAKRDVVLVDGFDEGVGVGQIGIRVASSKIGQGFAVLDGGWGKPEFVDEDGAGVRTCDTMQTVKKDLEVLGVFVQELLDEWEIKYPLEESNVISNRVDDGHFRRPISEFSDFGKIKLPKTKKKDGRRGWDKKVLFLLTGGSSMTL